MRSMHLIRWDLMFIFWCLRTSYDLCIWRPTSLKDCNNCYYLIFWVVFYDMFARQLVDQFASLWHIWDVDRVKWLIDVRSRSWSWSNQGCSRSDQRVKDDQLDWRTCACNSDPKTWFRLSGSSPNHSPWSSLVLFLVD